ncbi:uncharacterized protein METZ01_LOCUS277415 [marine metagenome]|uniref:Uncharacterized protein n=1 Tax=marine metagenome TaxID=408172 RepID=A0A382KPF6_9ZZZZ
MSVKLCSTSTASADENTSSFEPPHASAENIVRRGRNRFPPPFRTYLTVFVRDSGPFG